MPKWKLKRRALAQRGTGSFRRNNAAQADGKEGMSLTNLVARVNIHRRLETLYTRRVDASQGWKSESGRKKARRGRVIKKFTEGLVKCRSERVSAG